MKQYLFRWRAPLHALFLSSLFLFGAGLAPPAPASAADLGLYVTPKFIYGYTVMDKLKGNGYVEAIESYASSHKSREADNAWGGALAVGYNFDKRFQIPLRTELEYSLFSRVDGKVSWDYISTFVDDHNIVQQKLDIQTLFLNVYYDIKTGTPVTPYFGAGIGLACIDARTRGYNDFYSGLVIVGSRGPKSNTNLAWNIGGGLGWNINELLTLDLAYRFVSLGEAKGKTFTHDDGFGDIVSLSAKTENLYMHQVMLGLRFNF